MAWGCLTTLTDSLELLLGVGKGAATMHPGLPAPQLDLASQKSVLYDLFGGDSCPLALLKVEVTIGALQFEKWFWEEAASGLFSSTLLLFNS